MKRVALAGRVIGFAALLGAISLGLVPHAVAAPPGVMNALDTDSDGTVDLAEGESSSVKAIRQARP